MAQHKQIRAFPASRAGRAFTLVEVLIAMGLAAIFLSVILNAVAHNTLAVSQASSRYQNVLWASQALEVKMEQGGANNATISSVDPGNQGIGANFTVNLSNATVLSDARFQAVRSEVGPEGGGARTVTGFRLLVRRPTGATNATTGTSH